MAQRPPVKSAQSKPVPDDDTPQDATPEDYVGTSDEMREDSTPAVKPPGSPALWPFAQLPRRVRANFFHYLRSLGGMGRLAELKAGSDVGENLSAAADFYLFAADAEDAIRVVAHPSTADKLDEWLDKSDDEELIALLMWYLETFQPGEASRS